MGKQRLNTIIKKMRYYHTKNLKPIKKHIRIQTLLGVDGSKYMSTGASKYMGTFYEILSQALYGGKFGETFEIELEDRTSIMQPDIVNYDDNTILEVKACHSKKGFILQDEQVMLYKNLQRKFLEGYKNYPKIYFALYAHPHYGIKSWNGTLNELYSMLCCEKLLYSAIVPLSLILELHKPERGTTGLVYRYDRRETRYDNGTKVRSSAIIRLLSEPEKVIEELGLKKSDYNIERLKVPVGMHMTLDVFKRIRQFPIVRIEHNYHDKWANSFVDQYLEDVPF